MTNPISSILKEHPLLVIDGGLATELEQRGCMLKDQLWSAKILMGAPEMIKDVHCEYFRAGADCAITSSYQATLEGFMKRGITRQKAGELIGRSVHLALQARDEFWRVRAHIPEGGPDPSSRHRWDRSGPSWLTVRSITVPMGFPRKS